MKIKGKVMSATTDTRTFVDTKTGNNRQVKITNVLVQTEDGEVISCRSFDENTVLPVVGKDFILEPRRYEKKGLVAEVVF